VLGNDTIKQFVLKMVKDTDQASKQTSDMLPKVVDTLTAHGQIPQGDLMSKDLDVLKGLIK
jgi:uncharacterized protein YidB (DUF937 family)